MRAIAISVERPVTGDVVQVCVLAPIPRLTLGSWVQARITATDDSGFSSAMLVVDHPSAWRYWRHEGETWRRFDPTLETLHVGETAPITVPWPGEGR